MNYLSDQPASFDSLFMQPFSEEELLLAYRVSLPESEARKLVEDGKVAWQAMRVGFEFSQRQRIDYYKVLPEGVEPAFGAQLSEDLLVTLSLLGPEVEARVLAYRQKLYGPFGPTRELQEEFMRRRAAVAEFVQARVREKRQTG